MAIAFWRLARPTKLIDLHSFDLSLINATENKLLTSYPKQIELIFTLSIKDEWISALDVVNNSHFYLGTVKGTLFDTANPLGDVSSWKKRRLSPKERSITAICTLNNEFLFTSGQDNLIRVHRLVASDDEEEEEKEDLL
jgi:hypothetical protein